MQNYCKHNATRDQAMERYFDINLLKIAMLCICIYFVDVSGFTALHVAQIELEG